jgi:hypothetical protein
MSKCNFLRLCSKEHDKFLQNSIKACIKYEAKTSFYHTARRVEKADKLDFVEFIPFIFLVLFSNENAHQHIRKYLLKVFCFILIYCNKFKRKRLKCVEY